MRKGDQSCAMRVACVIVVFKQQPGYFGAMFLYVILQLRNENFLTQLHKFSECIVHQHFKSNLNLSPQLLCILSLNDWILMFVCTFCSCLDSWLLQIVVDIWGNVHYCDKVLEKITDGKYLLIFLRGIRASN